MSLLKGRNVYKPFTYERFFVRWQTHEKSHWLPNEVPMHDDIDDWENKLTVVQKEFLTNVFRFFTQGDVDVANAYYTQYLPFFRLPEVTMMLGSFAAREAIHIAAYSYLIETLGMPESTYSEFLEYKEMKEKNDYVNTFCNDNILSSNKDISKLTSDQLERIATSIALFSGFVEGMQLFSTFAMLLIFPQNGFMKNMGSIVSWSIADETQHVDGMMDLFRTFVEEYRDEIRIDNLRENIIRVAREMVMMEKAFIDLVFDKYDSKEFFGLTSDKLKLYIEFIADHRLKTMGFDPIFLTSQTNPLPELAVMINAPTHTNFFENTSTDYANVSTTGKWSDVWSRKCNFC